MWTQQVGVYSCLSHFKLLFILEEIIQWICDLPSQSSMSVKQLILHNWEIDQGAEGDRRIVHDWLEPPYVWSE